MSDEHDNDLRAFFARQRRLDHEDAPVWRGEWLNRPISRSRASVRWIPASLATACIAISAAWFMHSSKATPQLSDLPPLFDAPPAELFAGVRPSFIELQAPSDFLLPDHLQSHIP